MPETNRSEPDFLPDFCNVRVLFLTVLTAQLLAILISLATTRDNENYLFNLAISSLFVQWITLVSASLLCICRKRLTQFRNLPLMALSAWGICLCSTALVTECAWWLLAHYQMERILHGGHPGFFLKTLCAAGIIVAVYLRHLYVNQQWHRHIEVAAQSRFRALQARIRPHFLFNCLNAIAAMIKQRPDDAETAVEDLADLIRFSLDSGRNVYLLEDELTLCRKYLRIETNRLGKRLRVHWGLSVIPTTAHIPQLTLQPLLENAIYHGVETLEKGCVIDIQGRLQRSGYEIQISNIRAARKKSRDDDQEHVSQAMENVRRRLHTIYGQDSRLDIREWEEHYRVNLFIPVMNVSTETLQGFDRTTTQR